MADLWDCSSCVYQAVSDLVGPAKNNRIISRSLKIFAPLKSLEYFVCLKQKLLWDGWSVVRCCFQLKTFQTRLITSQKHIIYSAEFFIPSMIMINISTNSSAPKMWKINGRLCDFLGIFAKHFPWLLQKLCAYFAS